MAGCSSSGDSDAATATAPPQKPASSSGLGQTLEAYSKVLLVGEPSASYGYLSATCKQTWAPEAWANYVTSYRKQLLLQSQTQLEELKVIDIETRNVSDTGGEATATIAKPDGSPALPPGEDEDGKRWSHYVYEDGAWRVADCPTFGTTTTTTAPAPS
jgi:hypothetical protein